VLQFLSKIQTAVTNDSFLPEIIFLLISFTANEPL
jgi:hypothetical protein